MRLVREVGKNVQTKQHTSSTERAVMVFGSNEGRQQKYSINAVSGPPVQMSPDCSLNQHNVLLPICTPPLLSLVEVQSVPSHQQLRILNSRHLLLSHQGNPRVVTHPTPLLLLRHPHLQCTLNQGTLGLPLPQLMVNVGTLSDVYNPRVQSLIQHYVEHQDFEASFDVDHEVACCPYDPTDVLIYLIFNLRNREGVATLEHFCCKLLLTDPQWIFTPLLLFDFDTQLTQGVHLQGLKRPYEHQLLQLKAGVVQNTLRRGRDTGIPKHTPSCDVLLDNCVPFDLQHLVCQFGLLSSCFDHPEVVPALRVSPLEVVHVVHESHNQLLRGSLPLRLPHSAITPELHLQTGELVQGVSVVKRRDDTKLPQHLEESLVQLVMCFGPSSVHTSPSFLFQILKHGHTHNCADQIALLPAGVYMPSPSQEVIQTLLLDTSLPPNQQHLVQLFKHCFPLSTVFDVLVQQDQHLCQLVVRAVLLLFLFSVLPGHEGVGSDPLLTQVLVHLASPYLTQKGVIFNVIVKSDLSATHSCKVIYSRVLGPLQRQVLLAFVWCLRWSPSLFQQYS